MGSRPVSGRGSGFSMMVAVGALLAGGLGSTGAAAGQALPPDTVTTAFTTDTISGYGGVGGVAVDALGYVYVADFRNTLWRLSPEGDLTKFADGLYGASGVAVGPNGDIYQSSFYGDHVSRISRAGDVETWVDSGLAGPVGIAVAPDGTLFVVNCRGGSVSRIAPDRTVTEFARHDLMACPNGITFDDRGDLYVVNFNNTKILRISQDGAVFDFADIPGGGGNGHITFSRGAFFVTKLRGNQVFRVQRNGEHTVLAGTGVAGGDDGPALAATFTRPNGIAAGPGGGTLWVNDQVEGQGLGIGPSVVSLRKIRVVGLADVLTALGPDAGPDQIRTVHASYHRARQGEDSSVGAIALAYQWFSGGRVPEAMTLFQLNAESFPEDANARFHFGEAYRYTGRPSQAAEQYREVLELSPGHTAAAARLAEVAGTG